MTGIIAIDFFIAVFSLVVVVAIGAELIAKMIIGLLYPSLSRIIGPASKIFGYVMVLASIAMIITLRIAGVDLTEGQLFVKYWIQWLAIIGCSIYGSIIIIKNK